MSSEPTISKNSVDKRAAVRHETLPETDCLVSLTASDAVWPGWLVNISTTGIAVLLEEQFASGTVLEILIQHKQHQVERRLCCEVKHSEIRYPNEAWLHGCEFLEPLGEADVFLLSKNAS